MRCRLVVDADDGRGCFAQMLNWFFEAKTRKSRTNLLL
jgi:hypothetical protein